MADHYSTPQRKSTSTRTRFEVFKRDGFACRYCGRRAPDVELHVDHVVPVAAGGTNDSINLVTACADCNAGKSDIPLDASTATVNPSEMAASIRDTERALREYNAEVVARDDRLAADRERLYRHMLAVTGWSYLRPRDYNWLMDTVRYAPVEVVIEKITAASCSRAPKRGWISYIKACLRRWVEEGY